MKRILLVAHAGHAEAVDAMESLANELQGEAEIVGMVTSPDEKLTPFKAEAVISFGGDGTILNVARRLGSEQVPVLGVNLGRLGYLAEYAPGEAADGVRSLLAGKASVGRRMMLACAIAVQGEPERTVNALNDVVVSTAVLGRIGEVTVTIDDKPLTTVRGDGIILATPTGSTAYSLSAGGPILSPELAAMVLTPVCTHELANRPLVIPEHETVGIGVDGNGAPVCVAVDGVGYGAHEGKTIRIMVRRSEADFLLVHHPEQNRYDILRRKLGWGGGKRG